MVLSLGATWAATTRTTRTAAVKQPKQKPEIFSAYDPEFGGPEEDIPALPEPPAPIRPVAKAASPADPRDRFDTVPSAQAEGIVKRLKLIEELIQKYGRAYDYRVLTVKELETILAKLDEQTPSGSNPSNEAKEEKTSSNP